MWIWNKIFEKKRKETKELVIIGWQDRYGFTRESAEKCLKDAEAEGTADYPYFLRAIRHKRGDPNWFSKFVREYILGAR